MTERSDILPEPVIFVNDLVSVLIPEADIDCAVPIDGQATWTTQSELYWH